MSDKLFAIYILAEYPDSALGTYRNFINCNIANDIYLVVSEPISDISIEYNVIHTSSFASSAIFKKLIKQCKTEYLLLVTGQEEIQINNNFEKEFLKAAKKKNTGIVYSDFYDVELNKKSEHPLIDHQLGSIRDDFDFGRILLLNRKAAEKFLKQIENYNHAGLYSLRLSVSEDYSLIRVPEYLYTVIKKNDKRSGEKQFDYVDPKSSDTQIEMERVFTEHLKKTGAYLKTRTKSVELNSTNFDHELSVIIPVKNRVKTIMNAVNSALKQKTDFAFNIIIVDNHSTDGTTKLLKSASRNDSRILHIIPQEKDLEIGGCWNIAIEDRRCGRFAVQLDSDDVYKDDSTLKKIVDKFYEENCAMVIGSYELTDFEFKIVSPGLINHKEWTDENGHNNALRINGLGAPRAFFTPVIRKIKFPNVSYGEDYAVALAISREYKIGRIYESIYFCRRWEGNTDSGLSLEKENLNNIYKDRLRSNELVERQNINKIKQS